MPLRRAFRENSAHQGTGAFNLIKELYLEVPRFPLNLPGNSVPDVPAPWPGQLYEALELRCRLLLRDSNSLPHPQATRKPLADFLIITNCEPQRNPQVESLTTTPWAVPATRINTGDLDSWKIQMIAGTTVPEPLRGKFPEASTRFQHLYAQRETHPGGDSADGLESGSQASFRQWRRLVGEPKWNDRHLHRKKWQSRWYFVRHMFTFHPVKWGRWLVVQCPAPIAPFFAFAFFNRNTMGTQAKQTSAV